MTEPRDEARAVLAEALHEVMECADGAHARAKGQRAYSTTCERQAGSTLAKLAARGYRLTTEPAPDVEAHHPTGIGVSNALAGKRRCALCGEDWPCVAENARRAAHDTYEASLHDGTSSERRAELLAATRPPEPAPDVEARLVAAINDHADLRLPDGDLAIRRAHVVEVVRAALHPADPSQTPE